MVIDKIVIQKFRGLENVEIPLGRKITVISGHNGTMKTTLLGIIGQGMGITRKEHPLYGIKTIDGYNFRSQFKEKFKLSPILDKAGDHAWDYYISNNDIYSDNNGIFGIKSIIRDKESNEIRFWNKKGKSAGDGYIQCPVVYLSLKRLLPIGEENNIKFSATDLTEEEKKLFKDWYDNIFTIVSEEEYSLKKVSSSNKDTIGIENDIQDIYMTSAGQDNVGKILSTLLSFKRIKEKYPNDYKGGILLIDELEATLHPSAIKKLLNILEKQSEKLNLQIVFTTHNHDLIIKEILGINNKRDYRVIYLTKRGKKIYVEIDPQYKNIVRELYLDFNAYEEPKIKAYCEDDMTLSFLKKILPIEYKRLLDFQKVKLGCDSYLELVKQGFDEFKNSLIFFDADQNGKTKYSNVVALPGEYLPERELYEFFNNLDEDNSFWSNIAGGFSKQICFKNYLNGKDCQAEYYKNWYYENKAYLRKGITMWKNENREKVDKFLADFKNAYNLLAEKNNVDKI